MRQLVSPYWIAAKGLLFLFLAIFSAALLLLELPTLRLVFLFLVSVWAFCRFYFFLFYVVEHYIQPSFKYAGLGSFLFQILRARRAAAGTTQSPAFTEPSPPKN